MSEARDHHFVPQFYLRNFSNDGKSINLFNFRTGRTITGASIKGQCQKRGLHDYSPALEKSLGEVEGHAAKAIKLVSDTGRPATFFSDDDVFLKFFIGLQKSRTLKIGEEYDKHTDYFAKKMMSSELRDQGIDPSSFSVKSKFPVSMPMYMYAKVFDKITDLQAHLFVNKTKTEFITADHPAVTHNHFAEAVRWVGVLGFYCVGIQLWLPLSPRHLYMLYDQTAYRVGTTRREKTTYITDAREVDCFNDFQILNAQNNIYFSSAANQANIEVRAKALAKQRGEKRLTFVTSARHESDGSRKEVMVHFERLMPLNLNISSINVQRNKRRIPPNQRSQMWRVKLPDDREQWVPDEFKEFVRYSVEKIESR